MRSFHLQHMPDLENLDINGSDEFSNINIGDIMAKVQEKVGARPESKIVDVPQIVGNKKKKFVAPSGVVQEVHPETLVQEIDLDAVE
eukprot:3063422-Pyramimonas_sp.AAC.2